MVARLFATLVCLGIAVHSTMAQTTAPTTTPTTGPQIARLKDGAPDPLVMADGTRVTTADQWRNQRRPELLALFTHQMYGQMPPRPANLRFKVVEEDANALGGKATRRQVKVYLTGKENEKVLDLLIYIPNRVKGPVPVVLGLNFWGNQTINADPTILLSTSYMESGKNNPYLDLSAVRDNRATEETRGINARQWPIETILSHGYALATMYRCDIDTDQWTETGWKDGIRALYPELHVIGDNFTAMGAWAWSISRGVDYLVTDSAIDPKRVAIFGWSRLGKAALWAGANDERVALVLSQESGSGGVKLFTRGVGESVARLNNVFTHWYCKNFRNYIGMDKTMPFDQNEVVALIAPRPINIASAQDDSYSYPEGEFWGAKDAEPVYLLLGAGGLPVDQWPPVNHPVLGQIGYFMRPGGHDVLDYDWQQHLAFMDLHFHISKP